MRKGRDYRHYTRAALLLLLTILYNNVAVAKFSDRFTKERPLRIVCDWNLPPYEFLDDEGRPAGYTVDVMDAIMKKLDIPYEFVMRDNIQQRHIFQQHGADIMVAPASLLQQCGSYMSTAVLSYFRPMAITRKNRAEVHGLRDIPEGSIMVVRDGDNNQRNLLDDSLRSYTVECHPPQEALTGILNGRFDFFVWAGESLKWLQREHSDDSLEICDLDLPMAEMHVGAYDMELIDAIDDQYARLEQKGDVTIIRDKWFHPERRHDGVSPATIWAVVLTSLLLLTLLLLNRLIKRRVENKVTRNSEQTRMMNMVLDMAGYKVATYNVQHHKLKNERGELVDEHQTLEEVLAEVHPDDLPAFMEEAKQLSSANGGNCDLQVRRRQAGTAGSPAWQYLTGSCIGETDENNTLANYLLVAKDITKDVEEQQANNELAVKYAKAFDIALIAMSFYDAEGRLLDMNEQMIRIVGSDKENMQFFKETKLFEAPLFRDVLTPGMTDVMHACQHMYYPDIKLDKYLEYRIRPVFTDEGEIRYYVVTVRDITAERNLYLEQQATERQLKVTTDEVNRFEAQMNDLLSNSGMFIWRSNTEKRTVKLSRSLRKTEHHYTFDQYQQGLVLEEQEEGIKLYTTLLEQDKPVSTVCHFRYSPLTRRESWFAVSGMPYHDRHGKPIGYFGIVRDVTQLMLSQEELRRETARAQQSGQLKATFLANMTHEIRTPLNAIVGFSDLLHAVETQEERQEFIRIIRHNCDLLLRLIDDILETSYMDERPQSIEPEDIDFARYFDEVSQTVAQRVQQPEVSFISDNPYTTFPARIDRERIQQVVTNFVTNAVKYTQKGHIKVGYRAEWRDERGESDGGQREIREGIYIYCEDTGAGIPKEKQATVFERFVKLNDFVQGTGLGLSICKSIAERCNGHIGLMSEGEGTGSTFWIWIPRYLTSGNLTAIK